MDVESRVCYHFWPGEKLSGKSQLSIDGTREKPLGEMCLRDRFRLDEQGGKVTHPKHRLCTTLGAWPAPD